MYKHGEYLFKSYFETKWAYVIIFVATVFFVYAGMYTSSAYSLPFFAPFGVILPLFYAIKLSRFDRGIRHLIWWAFIFSISIYIFTIYQDYTVQQTVTSALPFTNSKFKWIKHNDLSVEKDVITNYVTQYFFICISSFASGGIIALLIISREISKIAFYVGLLSRFSTDEFVSFLIGWEIWTVVRIAGFLYTIMALSSFFLYWVIDFELQKRQIIKYFIIGFLLVVTSFILKIIFLEPTRKILEKCSYNLPIAHLPGDEEGTSIFIFDEKNP